MNSGKKTPICPVTFVKDNPVSDKNMNGMFTMPYQSLALTGVTHSAITDSLKREYLKGEDDESTHRLTEWAFETAKNDILNGDDAIISYIMMNVRDISLNIMISMFTEIFNLDVSRMGGEPFAKYIDAIDKCILNGMQALPPYRPIIGEEVNAAYIHYNSIMNSIYSRLVAVVFDRSIIDTVFWILDMNEKGSEVVDKLYEVCFGEAPKNPITPQEAYTLLTTIYREQSEQYMISLREGLAVVAFTCANMEVNRLAYSFNAMNKDYNTAKLVDENKYIQSDIIDILNYEGK